MVINWIRLASIGGGILSIGGTLIEFLTKDSLQDQKIAKAVEKAVKAALEAKEGS